MSTYSLYVGHTLSDATPKFAKQMMDLRYSLATIPDVEILRFAWTDGVGPPDESVNVYENDEEKVIAATLCVFIIDEPSTGLGGEMVIRFGCGKPFLVFRHEELRPASRFVTDGIKTWRQRHFGHISPEDFPDPIIYNNNGEIRFIVGEWFRKKKIEQPELLQMT